MKKNTIGWGDPNLKQKERGWLRMEKKGTDRK